MENLETLRFLNAETATDIQSAVGTPAYVYSLDELRKSAETALQFPNAYGLTVRFAMKASPNTNILKIFDSAGLHFDASSGFEVERAMIAGIAPEKISLSTQEYPANFKELYSKGIEFNACSISQLESFGKTFPGKTVGIRFNPGLGSGGTGKTNVGGPGSSFGIWHEHLDKVKSVVEEYGLKVIRIHTHIGSGSDPEVWQRVSGLSLNLVKEFPDVTVLNLGGGYKVGRMADEKSTDLLVVGQPVKDAFVKFNEETGRELRLEIEPGTFLTANTCALLTRVQDIVDTGSDGYQFLKLDSGMTDVLRPSLYGAQHPLVIISASGETEAEDYIVVGHCCESGDLLTPAPDKPEDLLPRKLTKATQGDLCVIEGCGSYCSSMAATNYNSFPQAPEVLLEPDGKFHVMRARQKLEQIVANEVKLDISF